VVSTYPSEKYDEFVSWDDYSIPKLMESHKVPWFPPEKVRLFILKLLNGGSSSEMPRYPEGARPHCCRKSFLGDQQTPPDF